MNAEVKPAVSYWHLWTDEQGISHQTLCELSEFNKAPIQPKAAPQWIGSKTKGDATIFVTVLPPGWVGDWHENPKAQWIVPLSGRWFVESMDGKRVEMGPGEMSFGEDQKAREVNGKKGHLSGTVGDEPAVLLLVQLEALPGGSSPCRFS
ncbi:MAG: cupin domain-containing protein [Rhodomicrobium sp.]